MSTYAVFGMTRPRAVEMARRRVKTSRKDPDNPYNVIQLSATEWEAEVQAAADATMAGTQCVQLSEMFDAPVFAFEYLDLARKTTQARGLHVKSHAKTGEKNPKTGKPVLEWKLVSEDDATRHSKRA